MQNYFTFSTRACAKVNLNLKVTGIRENGYHELESNFIKIPWLYDDIVLDILFADFDDTAFSQNISEKKFANKDKIYEKDETDKEPNITCNVEFDHNTNAFKDFLENRENIKDEFTKNNIVIKTAHKFLSSFMLNSIVQNISIFIRKRIPIGGGLGGGSSDAASVIMLLNKAITSVLSNNSDNNKFKLISPEKLQEISLTIGADVPFFLSEYNAAYVSGIGEKLSKTKSSSSICDADISQRIMIITPHIRVNTAEVYAEYDKLVAFNTNNLHKSTSKIQDYITENDLYHPSSRLYPLITQILEYISINAKNVEKIGMSGSGGSCFIIFDDVKSMRCFYNEIHETNDLLIRNCSIMIDVTSKSKNQ